MSLANTLLTDFSDSELEFDGEEDVLESKKEQGEVQDLLTITEPDSIESIRQFCPLVPKLEVLEKELEERDEDGCRNGPKPTLSPEEQHLLSETNRMMTEIGTYFNVLNSFIKLTYGPTWPDLFNMVDNPLLCIEVIRLVQFDLALFKEHVSKGTIDFLPKDQILSLTMSLNFLLKQGEPVVPTEHTQQLVLEACELQRQINQLRQKFRLFLTRRATALAPNLTALVGASVAAQLISTLGLEVLCSTPACNLPSVGKHSKDGLGYVYAADLVKQVPEAFKKQAVRQVCSKIVMCARVDLSHTQLQATDPTMGAKWRSEIGARLEKLMAPPETVQIKPLAKPVDMKSKKRGGRKFKKMRERMKMSDVEKAQNKMAFGEQEVTRTDAFGEDVGLGMLGKSSIRDIGTVRGVHLTKGTRERISDFKNKVTKPSNGLSDLL